jgi:hypothetical protein
MSTTTTVPIGADQKYCSECAKVILRRAEICPGCGCRQVAEPNSTINNVSTSRFKAFTEAGPSAIFVAVLFLRGLWYLGLLHFSGLALNDLDGVSSYRLARLAMFDVFISAALGCWGIWIATRMFRRKDGCLRKLRVYLITQFFYTLVTFALVMTMTDDPAVPMRAFGAHLTWMIVWFFYFKRSKTVTEVYGTNL